MADIKTFALGSIIFEIGGIIEHRNLGYTAKILKLYKRGNALIEIPNTPENGLIWGGNKLPMTFKALNLAKHFKHQIKQPILNL